MKSRWKTGKLADVHTIQSLRPESFVAHMDLYLEIIFSKSGLSRAEREMTAVVVSVKNGCEYCQLHHAQALKNATLIVAYFNFVNRIVPALGLEASEQEMQGYQY